MTSVATPSSRPSWALLAAIALVAGLLDAAQYLVFPCNLRGWFTPVIGFIFFASVLLFLILVRREGRRRQSLFPLALSALSALPWLLSHTCP